MRRGVKTADREFWKGVRTKETENTVIKCMKLVENLSWDNLMVFYENYLPKFLFLVSLRKNFKFFPEAENSTIKILVHDSLHILTAFLITPESQKLDNKWRR